MSVASVESSPSAAFTVEPLVPFGAKITGLDLAQPLDADTVDQLTALWAEHLVLLFPEQTLSEEQQVAFTRNFGALACFHEQEKISSTFPEILRVSNVAADGSTLDPDSDYRRYFATLTGLWHTDGSYKAVPSRGSMLHALEVPPEGGETWFCNMFKAYDEMPADMKAKIQGRHMVHNHEVTRVLCPGLPPMKEEDKLALPPVTHPLVRTHGDGRRSLFFTANVAYYVGGMELEDGKAFHKELMDHASQDKFVYKHKWSVGDVVMWDNRPTMHRVTDFDAAKHRRVLQRTELLGTELVQ